MNKLFTSVVLEVFIALKDRKENAVQGERETSRFDEE